MHILHILYWGMNMKTVLPILVVITILFILSTNTVTAMGNMLPSRAGNIVNTPATGLSDNPKSIDLTSNPMGLPACNGSAITINDISDLSQIAVLVNKYSQSILFLR